MTSFEDREKRERRFKFRNKHAQKVLSDPGFRIRRVENKKSKKRERLSTNEWLKKIERDELND